MSTGSGVRKGDPLSRYFKDLDSFGSDDDESDDNGTDTIENKNETLQKKDSSESTNFDDKDKVSNIKNTAATSCTHSGSDDDQSTKLNCVNSNKSPRATDAIKNDGTKVSKLSKLPSAAECLNSQAIPGFLKLAQKKEVNWDNHEKSLESENNLSVQEFKSNAVPPPLSYEPQTDPGIKVVDSEGRKRKRIEDNLEDQMTSTKAYKVVDPDDS